MVGRGMEMAVDARMLEDLAWLGRALKTARAEGEPLPPTLRLRMALTKK